MDERRHSSVRLSPAIHKIAYCMNLLEVPTWSIGPLKIPGTKIVHGSFRGYECPIPQNGQTEIEFVKRLRELDQKLSITVVDPCAVPRKFCKSNKWNDRIIDAVVSAMSSSRMIVFWDSGMDMSGQLRLVRTVAHGLDSGVSFIYISFPLVGWTGPPNSELWSMLLTNRSIGWVRVSMNI